MPGIHSHWQASLAAAMVLALSSAHVVVAQSPQADTAAPQTTDGSILLTVVLYIVMGIGQVVTLRVPAERLREVNRAVEETAWGAYRSEFYPTYDYKAVAQEQRKSAK